LDSLNFLCGIVLSRLKSHLSKDETRRYSSLILMISHYIVIKTMLMYFCICYSWPWGWLQMWPKHVW